MDGVGRDMYALNRLRDQLTAASEEMQRLRLMREERDKKEDEMQVLLEATRPMVQVVYPLYHSHPL
jgi:hypothetical protein